MKLTKLKLSNLTGAKFDAHHRFQKILLKGLLSLLLLASIVALALAQESGQRPAPDHLPSLRQALTEAGAPALSSDQETQLKALATTFHTAQNQPNNRTAMMAARTALDNAILAGDMASIQTHSAVIANLMSAQMQTRLQAEANFKVQTLALLNAGGQLTPLTQKFTAPGVLRLLGSLTFGGGRMGPPSGNDFVHPPFGRKN